MAQDLDQGGTFTTKTRVFMGHSIGWVDSVEQIARIIAGGTTTIPLGTSIVIVNVNAAVTIQLPQYKGSTLSGAIGLPGQFIPQNITIFDEGGFANAHNITVLPGSGETISGQANASIASNYGAMVLQPDPINGGTTVLQ